MSFVIAQVTSSTDPAFYTVPATVIFTGPRVGACAGSPSSSDFFIFGGTPPYTVLGSGGAALPFSPQAVAASGGRFTVFPQGTCFPDPGISISITDAAGRTITARVRNEEGTAVAPPLAVSSTAVVAG